MHPKHAHNSYKKADLENQQFNHSKQQTANQNQTANQDQAEQVIDLENPVDATINNLINDVNHINENEATGFLGDNSSDAEIPANLAVLCKLHICPMCPVSAEIEEAKDQRARAVAEMENSKKRLTSEFEKKQRYAAEGILKDLLPALDNLDRALEYGLQHEASKDFVDGVSMTKKTLMDILAKHGLTSVGAVGEDFSPEIHESVGFDDQAKVAKNSVAVVLQSGYRLGDRLLRPAMVKIKQ